MDGLFKKDSNAQTAMWRPVVSDTTRADASRKHSKKVQAEGNTSQPAGSSTIATQHFVLSDSNGLHGSRLGSDVSEDADAYQHCDTPRSSTGHQLGPADDTSENFTASHSALPAAPSGPEKNEIADIRHKLDAYAVVLDQFAVTHVPLNGEVVTEDPFLKHAGSVFNLAKLALESRDSQLCDVAARNMEKSLELDPKHWLLADYPQKWTRILQELQSAPHALEQQ